uniref:Hairy/enhancer-of-split related with YRPW motif protein 2-like n=1 Tax=Callorhinchus milii TaxID=7868 RepID=A0A4W3HM78_CALMI|eukprot:gi/632987285/ref/XP_007910707.1/ PREDICTED: hairy/enhancer-of-split related with YRPW motif protein 2-like [Callorhinchus milii]
MKRFCEENSWDSDVEELIDVGKEENYYHVSSSISATSTPHKLARKKRRGIIEKRRRDRINNSLSELCRLVPTAFEKQGTSKPEKAEILQMTVEHLKLLHAAGDKGYLDPRLLAVDYRSVGFRECLAEVMTYLGSFEQHEGRDDTDPLKDRLVSHLTSYVTETEPTPVPHQAWEWPYHHLTALLPHTLEVARLPSGDLPQSNHHPLFTGPALGFSTSALRKPTFSRVMSVPPALASPGQSRLLSRTPANLNLHLHSLTPSLHRALPNITATFPGVRSSVGPNKALLPGATTCLPMNFPSLGPSSHINTIHTGAAATPLSFGLFPPMSPFRFNAFDQTRSPSARKPNRSWTTEIGAF